MYSSGVGSHATDVRVRAKASNRNDTRRRIDYLFMREGR